MALVQTPAGIWLPSYPIAGAASGYGMNTITADASDEKVGLIFQVPRTGTLKAVGYASGTSVGNPNVKVSFQNVDANYLPDDTADEYRVVTNQPSSSWNTTGIITTDGTDGGTKRSVTRGQWMAAVWEFDTFDASDIFRIVGLQMHSSNTQSGYYGAFKTSGGAWAKQTGSGLTPLLGLQYDDDTYEFIGTYNFPVLAFTTHTFNSGSTPDERGLKFKIAAPTTISSFVARLSIAAGINCDFVLYDSDGSTVLETVTVDSDSMVQPGTGGNCEYFFTSDHNLTADTWYRLVAKPGASNISMYSADASSAALLRAAMGGSDFIWTERTNGGAWTDTDTKFPIFGVRTTKFDDGTGGGSAVGYRVKQRLA